MSGCGGGCGAGPRGSPPGMGRAGTPGRPPQGIPRGPQPTHHQHQHHHQPHHNQLLADRMMDHFGDGGVWNESSAMSLQDFEQSGTEGEEELCPPCEPPPKPPKQVVGECAPCANASHGGQHDSKNMAALAAAPSNISVFDAEELNITTAPRNADCNVPRNRIWQTLASSLEETEQQEEDEYMEFIAGIQNERREFFERRD